MSGAGSEDPYWSQDASALAAALGAGLGGLTSDRAAAQLALVGPNSVEDAPRLSALRLLLRQFESPLVLILAFAAAISLVLRQWMDAAIILAIGLGSALLSFFQEYRASTAVEELKRRLTLMCRVLRDGVEQTVPVSTVVPGDLILLSAGNLIPADGLVIEAQDFLVSQASMTGESFPVEKRPGMISPDAPIAARTNAVFLGASVRSGTVKVLAVRTGRRTEFGAIAARLRVPARGSANPVGLHLRRDLSGGGERRGSRPPPVYDRGHEPAPSRDLTGGRAWRACARPGGPGGLASVQAACGPGQHHPRTAPGQGARVEPRREHLAVHARELDLEPDLRRLQRHSRSLLRRVEQAHRSALAHYVHWTEKLGSPVLINGTWY